MNTVKRRRTIYPAASTPGGSVTVAVDGHNTPGTDTWQILHSGTVIATDSVAVGWDVVYASGSDYTITIPTGTSNSTGNAYEFRAEPSHIFGGSMAFIADSGHFDVP